MNLDQYSDWAELKVRWRDAHSPHAGWHEVDEYTPEDAIAVTIGRLWKDCLDNYMTLVGTVFETEDGTPKTISDINHIPLGMILEIEEIHGSKERPTTGTSWS